MNIAMLVETLAGNNGVSRAVLALTERFAARGHEVHLYSSVNRLPDRGRLLFPDARVGYHWLPSLRGSWRTWSLPLGALLPMLALPLAGRALTRVVALRRHDVVVSHAMTVSQDVIDLHNDPQSIEQEKLSRTPFTIDPPRLRGGRRALRSAIEKLRFSAGYHRRVVAHSRQSAREVGERFGLAQDAVRVIPHGVDAAYFSRELVSERRVDIRARLGLAPDDVVYLYVGDSWKGLEFAIRGMARLPAGAPAVLFGAGPFPKDPFARLARELGVRFLCRELCSDVRALFGAADVMLNPTPLDTFGLVALEAMAMELPVVTTRHAGVSELLSHGVDSFVVPEAFDTEAIAAACERLLDADVRARMASQARRSAAAHDWDRSAVSHLALYDEILRQRGAAV